MNPDLHFSLSKPLGRFPGSAAYFYIQLDTATSALIKEIAPKGGWGSVRVAITAGSSSWKTSLFPRSGHNAYFFFVKASVRSHEHFTEGDMIDFTISLT